MHQALLIDAMEIKIVLLLFLLAACYTDINYRRIPNLLTYPLMLTGLAYNTYAGPGWLFSVLGILTGLALLLLPYMLYGMGAGDVKLLMGVGSVLGYQYTMYTGIAAGMLAALYVTALYVKRGKIGELLQFTTGQAMDLLIRMNHKDYALNEVQTKETIPFAVPILAGTVAVLLGRWLY